jgi:S-adenosylmethionine hydrolase
LLSGISPLATGYTSPKTAARFGGIHPTPFKHIVNMTDFNNPFSDGEIQLHQDDVREYLKEKTPTFPWLKMLNWKASGLKLSAKAPAVLRLSTAPAGNVHLQSLFILGVGGRHRQARNQDIVVSVVDTGVGQRVNEKGEQTHDRSILVTYDDKGQLSTPLVISPNNQSLGLISKSFTKQNVPHEIFPIDINKVESLESARKGITLANTFHGRDLFGVVAAYIGAGIDPRSFKDNSRAKMFVQTSDFVRHLRGLPTNVMGQPTPFYAVYDPTFDGNLKTSLVLSNQDRNHYKDWVFEVTGPNGKTLDVPFCQAFSEVGKGKPLMYLGSSYAPYLDAKNSKDAHFVELAINYASAAKVWGITPNQAGQMMIRLKSKPSSAE